MLDNHRKPPREHPKPKPRNKEKTMDRKRVQIIVGDDKVQREIYLDEMGEVELIRLKQIIEIHLNAIKVVNDIEKMQGETERNKDKADRQIRLLSGEEDHD